MKRYQYNLFLFCFLQTLYDYSVTFDDIKKSIEDNKLTQAKSYLLAKLFSAEECYNLIRVIAIEGDSHDHIKLIKEIYKYAGTLSLQQHTNDSKRNALDEGQHVIARIRKKKVDYTDLSYALIHNRVKVFAYLMEADNKKLLKKIGCPLLHSAVILNRIDIIKILLKHKISIDCNTVDNNSIWHTLATMESSSIAEVFDLIKKYYETTSNQKLDLETKNIYKETPLMRACSLACRSLRHENLLYLLENKSDINTTNIYGEGLLHRAMLWDCKKTIKILLEYGINPNGTKQQKKSPLHIGCDNFYPRSVSRLLKHKDIIVDIQDHNGDTPLHILLQKTITEFFYESWKKVVDLLIEAGAGWDIINDDGIAPLHYCINFPSLCTAQHMKKISDQHPDFNWSLERSDSGDTLVHQLIKKNVSTKEETTNALGVIAFLMSKKIDQEHQNKDGLTALTLCKQLLKNNESDLYYNAVHDLLSNA